MGFALSSSTNNGWETRHHGHFENATKLACAEPLLQKRIYDEKRRKWSDWTVIFERANGAKQPGEVGKFEYFFGGDRRKEGRLQIYTNVVDKHQQEAVRRELLEKSPTYFRQYSIQNTNEPRAHFCLHNEATFDFEKEQQPGYSYGVTKMKSKPLSTMPQIKNLAYQMQRHFPEYKLQPEESLWTIGVNAVLYRDGRDRMGYHADDDQDETLILTVLVSSPVGVKRTVSIRTRCRNGRKQREHGDEEFKLVLDAGDAYSMDGLMQKYYVHGVPSDKLCVSDGYQNSSSKTERIAIVMRRGRKQYFSIDSGRPLASLEPRRKVPYLFGNCIASLNEGTTYTRKELNTLNAHRSPQKGVSGNVHCGCDAIIVSGLREDGLGHDNLTSLMYACASREGALAILRSSILDQPIRVFRSSILKSCFRAIRRKDSPAQYRYDGLFRVVALQCMDQYTDGTMSCPITIDPFEQLSSKPPTSRIFLFDFKRVEHGVGKFFNRISSHLYSRYCIQHQKSMSRTALYHRATRWSPRQFSPRGSRSGSFVHFVNAVNLIERNDKLVHDMHECAQTARILCEMPSSLENLRSLNMGLISVLISELKRCGAALRCATARSKREQSFHVNWTTEIKKRCPIHRSSVPNTFLLQAEYEHYQRHAQFSWERPSILQLPSEDATMQLKDRAELGWPTRTSKDDHVNMQRVEMEMEDECGPGPQKHTRVFRSTWLSMQAKQTMASSAHKKKLSETSEHGKKSTKLCKSLQPRTGKRKSPRLCQTRREQNTQVQSKTKVALSSTRDHSLAQREKLSVGDRAYRNINTEASKRGKKSTYECKLLQPRTGTRKSSRLCHTLREQNTQVQSKTKMALTLSQSSAQKENVSIGDITYQDISTSKLLDYYQYLDPSQLPFKMLLRSAIMRETAKKVSGACQNVPRLNIKIAQKTKRHSARRGGNTNCEKVTKTEKTASAVDLKMCSNKACRKREIQLQGGYIADTVKHRKRAKVSYF